MRFPTLKLLVALGFAGVLFIQTVTADELSDAVEADYDQHLAELFDYFHRNPELSSMEIKTAARLSEELRAQVLKSPKALAEPVLSPSWKMGRGRW